MSESNLSIIFSPQKIGNIKIPNRLIRSATYESMATIDGKVTDDLIRLYENIAKGGVGLTISGASYIREDMRWLAKMVAVDSDNCIEELSKIAGCYHDVANELGNKSKIFLQIGACGVQMTPWGANSELLSSSSHENEIVHKSSKSMSMEEIIEIAECYGDAVHRAQKAGFDGIQYHGAHGYLITQFYSPYFNHRSDEFGGTLENRARFLLDVIKASKKKVGDQFPITIKMNGSDRIQNGFTLDDASMLASMLAKVGINAIEISSYIWDAGKLEKVVSLPPESQINLRQRNLNAYNLEYALEIKNELKKEHRTNIPIILVGGLYSYDKIHEILTSSDIEFYAMSRPLIRQPDLPSLWKKEPPFPEAECIHCNQCTKEFLVKGPKCKGIRCIVLEKLQRKKKNLMKVN